MNIKLKNKFLYFNEYKIKCAIGKRGITSKKLEGDNKTPRGTFAFKYLFYRKDRILKIESFLKQNIIKKNMGWCDDSFSKQYNKLIKFPFKYGAEKLWLTQNIYDLIVVINYNTDPIVKHKGSAIFLHIAKKNYSPTRGCIAIKKRDLILLIRKIKKETKLIIN
jgi:L,D-peptidoglycan transpeptidase YkuD (ErfK/YbiS/YcfS/YnhG family)